MSDTTKKEIPLSTAITALQQLAQDAYQRTNQAERNIFAWQARRESGMSITAADERAEASEYRHMSYWAGKRDGYESALTVLHHMQDGTLSVKED